MGLLVAFVLWCDISISLYSIVASIVDCLLVKRRFRLLEKRFWLSFEQKYYIFHRLKASMSIVAFLFIVCFNYKVGSWIIFILLWHTFAVINMEQILVRSMISIKKIKRQILTRRCALFDRYHVETNDGTLVILFGEFYDIAEESYTKLVLNSNALTIMSICFATGLTISTHFCL